MEVLDLLGFDVNPSLSHSQKQHRANERSNLLVISRVVLKSFLETSIKLAHRVLDGDIQQLSDLLMMLEKVLWHGFKGWHSPKFFYDVIEKFDTEYITQRTLLAVRPADAELWRCLTRISALHSEMNECVRCINNLDNLLYVYGYDLSGMSKQSNSVGHLLKTSIARVRAFLRLAVMQKKLSDYFYHILSSSILEICYEDWAFIRHEESGILAGSLVGLSVIDCNLMLDQTYLQEQPPSIDLSSYIRFPSLLSQDEQVSKMSSETSPKDLKILLDQKSYLEERNRYLEQSVAVLKTKIAGFEDALIKAETDVGSIGEISTAGRNVVENLEKERLNALVGENNDTINTLRQQLADTKKINEDLYTKIRMIEEKCKLFEGELIGLKERHIQEKEEWLAANEVLKSRSLEREAEMERNSNTLDMLKNELLSKTDEYMQTLSVLSDKQNELNDANLKIEKLQKQNLSFAEKLRRIPVLEEELAALKISEENQSMKLADYEKALEELGGHLSESGLRILELKEEFLPFSEAEWQDDAEVANCKACNASFSVSRRKHHCRSCGMIFCNSCSDGRVKLPSNPKPTRRVDESKVNTFVACFNVSTVGSMNTEAYKFNLKHMRYIFRGIHLVALVIIGKLRSALCNPLGQKIVTRTIPSPIRKVKETSLSSHFAVDNEKCCSFPTSTGRSADALWRRGCMLES
ncbi:unnamed protein product [Enterobius vermicularis]|uniref:RUN domain-containing protein n=1 Tax=Enterobius vermicularis TaxID=51028 RepID=A0A0N4V713_ENTVE|nr:unnamed protein product [Enterobius vermicularis]